jgi:hypothetical protein
MLMTPPLRGHLPNNAFIESFNRKFRTECLNANWFLSLGSFIGIQRN